MKRFNKFLTNIESFASALYKGYVDQQEFVDYVISNQDKESMLVMSVCSVLHQMPRDSSRAYRYGKATYNFSHLNKRMVAGIVVISKGLGILSPYDGQRFCDIPKDKSEFVSCVNERLHP